MYCPKFGSRSLMWRQMTRVEAPVVKVTPRGLNLGAPEIDWDTALQGELVCGDCGTEVDAGGRTVGA